MNKILFALFLFLSGLCNAQTGFKLKISGEVEHPLELSLSDLAGMPRKEAVLKDKEGKPFTYSGVPLPEILAKAGIPSGKEVHGANLSKYLLVRCTDGYRVLFSLAELDLSVTDKNVIIADKINGEPLFESRGPLRLVVEGEKKPARSCYQVTELIVGSVK
ncbi:MAG: molybdopterin-dependent oxidoreductase [Leadbetterella sp.]|nr:molybdopterin-dependent oxidoreductase [Leadbetterella sp.]